MLDLWKDNLAIDSAPQANEGRDLPATVGDTFPAAWAENQLFSGNLAHTNARDLALSNYMDEITKAGGDINAERRARTSIGIFGQQQQGPVDGLDIANAALAKARAKNPALQLQPLTEDDLSKRAVELSTGASATYAEMAAREKTFGGKAGMVGGGLAGEVANPMNIPALVVAPEAEVGILGHAMFWGGYGGLSQIENEVANAKFREQVQPGYAASGAPLENIVGSAVGGAVLGGGFKALGNLWTRLKTGEWPTSIRDAGNVVESTNQIHESNVLPGVEGEADHIRAMSSTIDQILKGEPVEPDIAPASRDLMQRLQSEQTFEPRNINMVEAGRLSEEAQLQERSAALKTNLATLPEGDAAAVETLARLQEVERQLDDNPSAAMRRQLSQRRDELLTDTTPEKLRADAAPIEQRRIAEAEQASIGSRLDAIAEERAKEALTPPIQPQANLALVPRQTPPTLFDIHANRIENLMEMRTRGNAAAEAPVRAIHADTVAQGISTLAAQVGHAMPKDEATGLAERVLASKSDNEARTILNQVSDRPRTLASTVPSPADFAAQRKMEIASEPQPRLQTREQMQETLKAPDVDKAIRADAERAIDASAAKGETAKVPIGVDEKGEPIYRSVASALDEIDNYRKAGDAIQACATGGATDNG